MLRALALPLFLAVAPTPWTPWAPGSAADQDPDPRALLEAAAQAAGALSSATYQARSSVTSSSGAAGHLSGEVRFTALEGEDPLGAKLFVRAKAPDASGVEIPFKLAYDGNLVQGQLGEELVVWTSSMAAAGGELLEVGEQLLMRPLFSAQPFADALESGELTLGAEVEVGGVTCREVTVQHGEELRGDRVTWALSLEDGLPRRRLGQVHRRGVFQTETLEISELRKNVGIHASVYRLPVPAGFESRPFVSNRVQFELLPIGGPAPELSLLDPEGTEFTLAARRGKVVVLDFWGTWCAPCRQAMPLVQKLEERFADDDRVEVWGVATHERPGSDPAAFMRDGGFTYGLLLGGEQVAPTFRVEAMPTFYVIGTGGEVLHASAGFTPLLDRKVGTLIERHLAAE